MFSRVATVLCHENCFITSHPVLNTKGHLSLKTDTRLGYLKTRTTRTGDLREEGKGQQPVLLVLNTAGLDEGNIWVDVDVFNTRKGVVVPNFHHSNSSLSVSLQFLV